jgi:hypothetical protein
MHLTQRIQAGITSAVFVAASVTAASAAPIVFTNEADFNAAVAAAGLTLSLESFEAQPSGPRPMPLNVGPFTLTAPLPVLAINNNPALVTHGTNALVVAPAFQPITFTFDTAIRAFSFDVRDNFNTDGGTIFGRIGSGAQQTFLTGGAGLGGVLFLGILDLDAAFTTLQFDGDGGLGSFLLDRVQYASDGNPTPVPEPASLTLLAAGLLAGARRLRARRGSDAGAASTPGRIE